MSNDENILGEIDSLLKENTTQPAASSKNELAQYFSNANAADDDDFFSLLSSDKTPVGNTKMNDSNTSDNSIQNDQFPIEVEKDLLIKVDYGMGNLTTLDDIDSLSGTSSTTQSQCSGLITEVVQPPPPQQQQHQQEIQQDHQQQHQQRVRFMDDLLNELEKSPENPKPSTNVNSSSNNFNIQQSKCAWIPSEAVHFLLKEKRYLNLTNANDSDLFTKPTLIFSMGNVADSPSVDPVKALLIKHCGGETSPSALLRHSITCNDVTQDERGLHLLIKEGWYRAAVELCGKLLANLGQGTAKFGQFSKHSPKSLFLWFTRFALMSQLKQWNSLEMEMASFQKLDTIDLYYEYYPEKFPIKEGSLVPFGMRILHAETPAYVNKFSESFDRLYHMLGTVNTIIANLSNGLNETGSQTYSTESSEIAMEIWKERQRSIIHSIVNVLLMSRDYTSAISLIHSHLNVVDDHHSEAQQLQRIYRSDLFSLLGRIYLQLGDVDSAKMVFNDSLQNLPPNHVRYAFRESLHNAFIEIGNNHFAEARGYFQECLTFQPNNVMACNNYAVCCLYLGLLRESIEVLEKLLENSEIMHDITVFNLCTLYELESSKALVKKLKILERVAKIPGDNLHISSFKVPTIA